MFNLNELRIRLECHFDMVCYAETERDDGMPDPLGIALLSAIDLLTIIESGKWRTVDEVVAAWETRGNEGRPKPKIVTWPRKDDDPVS